MAIIRSDNTKVKALLDDLVILVESVGGFLHKQLIIQCIEGNMILKVAKPVRSQELLIDVPASCIPIVEHFNLYFDGKKIDWEVKPENSSQEETLEKPTLEQIKAFEVIIELFNLNDKVNSYAEYSPLYAFRNSPIIEYSDRSIDSTSEVNTETLSDEELKLKLFLDSRIFSNKHDGSLVRLLPIIDFADHNSLADSFIIKENEGRLTSLGVGYSELKEKKSSIFVCYKQKDRLASALNYGFYDSSARYVQSVSVEVCIDDLTYHVRHGGLGSNMMPLEYIPKAVPGFRFSQQEFDTYLPTMRCIDNNNLEVHFCLFPKGKDIPAFKEVLDYQLKYFELRMQLKKGSISNEENILKIESSLISENINYYIEFKKIINNHPNKGNYAGKLLLKVCDYQIAHIENYVRKAGVII